MTRIWYVFWREYKGHLTRRSYLIFTFGFPFFMLMAPLVGGAMLALAIRSALPVTDPRPVGLVDQAELFAGAAEYPNEPVDVIPFSDSETAAAALARGDIQAYYDIPANYWETGQVVVTYDEPPTSEIDEMISGWVRARVRADVPVDLLTRITQGANITHQDLRGARAFSLEDVVQLALVFLPIYFVRLGSSFMAEYMFGSIASEAHDRTLEILITSVTPTQLVVGKLLGLLAVGLTQLGTWAAFALALGVAVGRLFGLDLLSALFGWEHLGLMVVVLLAAYVMDQVLAATLALFRVSGGAGSMLFNTVNWVVGLGLIYAIYFVPRNPHSPLAVAASIFPVTASIVLLIRVVVSEVPPWQIALALLSMWGTIFASIFWLRWLLQTNLVANTSPVSMRDWLKRNVKRFKKQRGEKTVAQYQG